ncbi:alpha-2-macroglobulin family protein [Tabrizicola sp. J26]|uniref:alpha-2-macroglobulin family protein n=1 Tax=Alitabrizicola rongguiensis TaxID=2909234 RepID=UPI001F3E4E63|nr:alpha-2-macroglobulin family protein [Tabrizicola rongguiensis]MCF1708100.1 alpha-2-macroglobulin family protein [Tabrizicola rongguiensis]
MRRIAGLGRALMVVSALGLAPLPLAAQDQPLIPERRFVLSENTDMPGGDLQSIFDTTIEACERACLADTQCLAFTFNSKNGSCFPKSTVGEGTPYAGAYSGRVVMADPRAMADAGARAADLSKFIGTYDLGQAYAQAVDLANKHITGNWTAEELMRAAADAEMGGDPAVASTDVGAALNLTDAPDQWVEYARLLLAAGQPDGNNQRAFRDRSLSAAINGYLRSADPAQQHSALVQMAFALESVDRGSDMVKALRLAQDIQPRDDTEALLDDAIGKYGFRVTETTVESDSARPRICATFSEDLVEKGVDYANFVQLPDPAMTVVPGAWRQLCVEGVEHGQRVTVTFRQGLPAADGQTLVKSVPITQYVRDRSPAARFVGRTYVLPRAGGAAIPVQTVNTKVLDLTLYEVSDRNMLRAIQNNLLGPMDVYSEADFMGNVGAEVWAGTADVVMDVNKDVTTRLPMDEAVKDLKPGVYALRAAAPGTDPYTIAPAWQWFVISDMGVTSMSGTDGLHVFVRSLENAGPKAGVAIDLVSRANAVLASATTDDQGYAVFDPGLTRGANGSEPAMIVLRDGDTDISFLSLTDPEFDLSDRGVEGREAAGAVDVFLTTDRGAYRAGETVNATALTRDAEMTSVEGLPLTAIISRPDGIEFSRQVAQDQGAGGHVFSFPISGGAPRGVWRMEVYADLDGPSLATKTFLVEDFLPERIDFKLALADAPVRLGDAPEATVDVRYLFGAPGGDLAIEGEALLRAADGLAEFPGFVFGREDEPFSAQMQPLEEGIRTDEQGKAAFNVALPQVEDPARPLELRLTVRVAEGSGRPVERQVVKPLEPTVPIIGVKPLFDGTLPENGKAVFDVIGVGEGNKAAAMQVKWHVDRISTDYQWYQQYGQWMWEPVTSRQKIAEGTAAPGSEPVQISTDTTWGDYELVVERTDGPYAATSVKFAAGWYGTADAATTPDMLDMSLDKAAYEPGETAKLRVVPRAAGTALVTVLSNRLIEHKTVDVAAGENIIDLPVTENWGAGVYVTVSALKPIDVAAGRNPSRALGLSYASIAPGDRQLKATIETAPEADPRGPMDVAVKVEGVQPGEKAYVTLAAVDVGILNLTAFESPDPSAYYFGQRKLGIGIRDLYGRLIDGMNGAEGSVRSGGDAGAQAKLKAPPPTEQLVAFFSGPLEVGADGLARATFDLPSFNGTVRVMAVTWSKTGVGQASTDVLVRDPVVVTASVPRFLAPGDESRLLLEIVHATGPAGRMGLDVTSAGLTLGNAPSGVDLAEKGKQVVSIPITAGEEGVDTIRVALTTPDGKLLTKDLTIPVQLNDPAIARISRFDLEPGQTFTFDQNAFAGLIPGTAQATLAVGPIARLNAPGLLASLDRYPYGCTEQLTSKAMPLLYLDQIAKAMELPGSDNIHQRIEETVAEVLTNQGAEGAFGLWGPGSGDFWLDSYATDFLSQARAQGIDVPDVAFRQALDNLRNQVNYQPDFDSGGEALAYALMVLAREGAAAVGDLRYYADVKGDAFSTPMAAAQLGAALASYGDQTRADAMFTRAAKMLKAAQPDTGSQIFRADFGSNRRDAAAVLTYAVGSGSNAVDPQALAGQLAQNEGNLSPQETAWLLLAANALLTGPDGSGITMNGQKVDGPLVRLLDSAVTEPVMVANTAAKPATLTVTAFGVPSDPVPAGGNGYAIARSYFTLDGQPADIASVKAGTRLVAVVDVTPFDSGEARLMVNDPLPAGFEIDNPNLIRGGDVSALDDLGLETEVTHAEFRQDRFLAALDRQDATPFRLGYIVRAVSPGRFHHPAASVEDMYRPDFRAQSDAGEVVVTP